MINYPRACQLLPLPVLEKGRQRGKRYQCEETQLKCSPAATCKQLFGQRPPLSGGVQGTSSVQAFRRAFNLQR